MGDARAAWLPPITALSVTAWPGEASVLFERLRATLGLELAKPGRWTKAGTLVCVWLSPDHWQVENATMRDMLPVVAPHGAVIDVSGARTVLRIVGPGSREVLARLVPIDLHPRAFAPHHAASTVAAHVPVQLRQIDAAPTYQLACPRSYAESFGRAAAEAGAVIG